MNSVLRSLYKTIVLFIPFSLLKFLKASSIFGLQWTYFSANTILMPVVGAHVSTVSLLSLFSLRTLWHIIYSARVSIFSCFYYLPSLCGAFYFRTLVNEKAPLSAKIVCSSMPLICIALFVTHPVGGAAYLYSMYWFIPALVVLIPRKSFFVSAVGSTLTTHAVGSLIFLYTTPMNAAFWLALIPVVLVERLLFACGITIIYYASTVAQMVTSRLSTLVNVQTH